MLQRRQIVKSAGNQIDTGKPVYTKYRIIYFHSIARMLIYVIVTIYQTEPVLQRYQTSSHWIMMTTNKLRSRIYYDHYRKFWVNRS
jgi:hypothetical protein